MSKSNPFKWRHYEPEIILLCVRWYLTYPLSYRQVAEMVRRVRSCRMKSESNSLVNERGLEVNHSTLYRWVQQYALLFRQAMPFGFAVAYGGKPSCIALSHRPHLRSTNDSWRVDETYLKVKGS